MKDSVQPGHSPNLIRVFPVVMMKIWLLSCSLSEESGLTRFMSRLIRVFPRWTDHCVGLETLENVDTFPSICPSVHP